MKVLLLASDFIAVNLASVLFLWAKFVGGTLDNVAHTWNRLHGHAGGGPTFWFTLNYYLYDALPAICACWLVLFVFSGLYRPPHTQSRVDEAIAVFRAVTVGVLLFFVATFDPHDPLPLTRAFIVSYWLALIALVAGGRVGLRSFQRQLLARGLGQRRAVVVGSDTRGVRLLQDLQSRPTQGYQVAGFVRCPREAERDDVAGIPVLGGVAELGRIIQENRIEAVLIALQSNAHEEVLEIVSAAEGQPVSFSITPDLYDIVTGHVRTDQIYGVPLMELRPELMPAWEQTAKRLIDLGVALGVGVGLLPLWLVVALAIKLDSPGPVLFSQERVGEGERRFRIFKFRSMVADAEERTGPVWVSKEDPRVTRVGRVLRTLHLDEVAQCINFFRGDMSLVGPRPERPYFVEKFRTQIPFYMRRFNVKPGLLGWAQAKHQFDMTSQDWLSIARSRLEYDLYYIENMSLKLDFKIMLQTIWFVLAGKSTR